MNTNEEKELRHKAVVAADAVVSAFVLAILRGFLIAVGIVVLIIIGSMCQADRMQHQHWTHHEDATGKWIPDKFE